VFHRDIVCLRNITLKTLHKVDDDDDDNDNNNNNKIVSLILLQSLELFIHFTVHIPKDMHRNASNPMHTRELPQIAHATAYIQTEQHGISSRADGGNSYLTGR